MLGKLNDLDIRLIRVFVSIVQAGGIVAAQRVLNLGQPTISMHLAALESRLGYRLCRRGRGGFELTPRGEQFMAASKTLLTAIETFELQARNLDKKLVGALTLGLIGHNPIESNAAISAAIARFHAREQAVRLSVTVRSPGELEDMLLTGSVDAAIGYFWRRVPTLDYRLLFREEQVAYCGSAHPLHARCGAVGFEEGDAFSWAWRNYPLAEREIPHIPPNIGATCDNMEAVAVLILSGRYLGYLPRHFAERYVQAGQLAALNPEEMRYRADFHLVTRRPPHRSDIIEAFILDVGASSDTAPASDRSKDP